MIFFKQNGCYFYKFFLVLSFIASNLILQTLSQSMTIIQSQLFDKIMLNDINGINSNFKSTTKENEIKNINSALLNRNNIIISHEFNLNRQLNGVFKVLYGNGHTLWFLNDGSMFYLDPISLNMHDFSLNAYDDQTEISDLFSSPFNKQFIIFTDLKNKRIFKSDNDFFNFTVQQLDFKPEKIYFTKDASVLFASEAENNKINFWLSVDFGDSWFLLKEGLRSLPKWNSKAIYYIDTSTQLLVRFDLLKFISGQINSNSIESNKKAIENISNAFDFELYDDDKKNLNENLLIKTKKNENFEMVKSFQKNVKKEGKRVNIPLVFNQELLANIKNFHILSFTNNEVYLMLAFETKNEIRHDLFESADNNLVEFGLSHKDIALMKTNDGNQIPEFKSLNDRGGVYLANFQVDLSEKKTFMKTPQTIDWNEIQFEDSTYNNYSLNLVDNFYYFHQEVQSLLRNPKTPEFILARATLLSESIICLYNSEENVWKKVLDGDYLYAVGDYGHIIVAVATNKKLNEIIYSFDSGTTWISHKFTKKMIIADNLIKDPYENSQSFTLFARNAFLKTNLVFKFNFANMKMQPKLESNQVRFECNQTCISQETFEETCVNTDDEKDLKKCVFDISSNSMINVDLQKYTNRLMSFINLQNFIYRLNQYIVPILIAFSIIIIIIALVVLKRSKSNRIWSSNRTNEIKFSKMISMIKDNKSSSLNTDKESLINNDDKSVYMLNIA